VVHRPFREFIFRHATMIEELQVGRYRLDAAQYLRDVGKPETMLGGQRPAREPAVLLEQALAKIRRRDAEVDRSSKPLAGIAPWSKGRRLSVLPYLARRVSAG
jgi:hypothetical protein